MSPPSYFVPRYFLYQSEIMIRPSGLATGTSNTITSSRTLASRMAYLRRPVCTRSPWRPGTTHFRGMQAMWMSTMTLAFLTEFPRLLRRKPPRITQTLRDRPVAIDMRHVLFRGHDRHQHRLAQSALADLHHRNPFGLSGKPGEIGVDLAGIGKLSIRSDLVPEKRLWRCLCLSKNRLSTTRAQRSTLPDSYEVISSNCVGCPKP